MTTGQGTGQDNNVFSALLLGIATFLMSVGGYIMHKMGKAPRPRQLIDDEYNRIMVELEAKLQRDIRPICESIEALSNALSTETESIRGEMHQMNRRLARQGGVLKGLEERFNNSQNN